MRNKIAVGVHSIVITLLFYICCTCEDPIAVGSLIITMILWTWLSLRLIKMRKPDNIVWAWPWTCFCIGYGIQRYGFGASAITLCLGPLTLRWHDR